MNERRFHPLTVVDQLCDFLVVSVEHTDCLPTESRGNRVNGRPRSTASANDYCCLKFPVLLFASSINALQRLSNSNPVCIIPTQSTLDIKIHHVDSAQHSRCIVEMIRKLHELLFHGNVTMPPAWLDNRNLRAASSTVGNSVAIMCHRTFSDLARNLCVTSVVEWPGTTPTSWISRGKEFAKMATHPQLRSSSLLTKTVFPLLQILHSEIDFPHPLIYPVARSFGRSRRVIQRARGPPA